MTRKTKARRRDRVERFTAVFPWGSWMEFLFRLAPSDYTPPAEVRLTHGHKRCAKGTFRCTWVAKYTTPEGQTVTYTTRARVNPDTKVSEVLGESFAIRAIYRPKAEAVAS